MSRIEAAADHAWQTDAACRGADPELFYDNRRGLPAHVDPYADARSYCRTCPVAVPCLELALASGDRHGFYAGTTPADRDAMTRRTR